MGSTGESGIRIPATCVLSASHNSAPFKHTGPSPLFVHNGTECVCPEQRTSSRLASNADLKKVFVLPPRAHLARGGSSYDIVMGCIKGLPGSYSGVAPKVKCPSLKAASDKEAASPATRVPGHKRGRDPGCLWLKVIPFIQRRSSACVGSGGTTALLTSH